MVSRRKFLIGGACCAAGALGLPKISFASVPGDKRFVLIILRGGMDGLAAVPPFADRAYREVRGPLALPEPGRAGGALALDKFFGLHPALAPLAEMFRSGEMAVVHAAATPYRERSHFDGQDLLERGGGGANGAFDGWLNRALGLLTAEHKPVGLAIGQKIPLVLQGKEKVSSWAPQVLPEVETSFLQRVDYLYRDDVLLRTALLDGLRSENMMHEALGEGGPQASGLRPRIALQTAAAAAAAMLRADAGPRIAVFDSRGWDTHANQGAADGQLARQMRELGEAVATLKRELGAVWKNTAVITVTEFGRTAAVNGTRGTDHGTASASFIAGGAVAGGRVIADWPGLEKRKLYQGRDLAPTTDLRSLLKALCRDHLEIPERDIDKIVFPGSGGVRVLEGIIRS